MAKKHLHSASKVLKPPADLTPPVLDVQRYAGATVVDPQGEIVGEVTRVSADSVELALGGWRNTWGFTDFGESRHVRIPTRELAFGPPNRVGMKFIAIPARESTVASK